jgi:hypothetical protein
VDRYLQHRRVDVCLHGRLAAAAGRPAQAEDKMAGHFEKLEGQYSPELVQLVRWCLQIDPLDRPQSLFALQKVLAAKPPVAASPDRSAIHAGQAARTGRAFGRRRGGDARAKAGPDTLV